jgi:lysozyme family protein
MAAAPRYANYWRTAAKRWDAMVIKQMRPSCASPAAVRAAAKKAVANKARYLTVEKTTGIPWFLIAALHERESSQDFGTYLGNGQSLKRRTTQVPAGRGPFTGPNAWERGAIDALQLDGLTRVREWRLEKILFYCEKFNGFGAWQNGVPSSYIWAGTSIQQPGKWIADHKWSASYWDTQIGVAALIAAMHALDQTINPYRET